MTIVALLVAISIPLANQQQAGGYEVLATPEGKSGRRSFFSDETLVIRQSLGPEPANAVSPEL